EECADRAFEPGVASHRLRPILDREARPVRAMEYLVGPVGGRTGFCSLQHGALRTRIRRAIRARMVDQLMEVIANDLNLLPESHHAQKSRVAERDRALSID